MKVLLLGSGGREHAIAWKLNQSKSLAELFIAPGNAGTAELGTNVVLSTSDFDEIGKYVLDNEIDMLIVGPEQPLVDGIHDFFLADEKLKSIPVIGPAKKAAMLEGSKDFAKSFMSKYNIPTAEYQTFEKNQLEEGYQFLQKSTAPYVLKADGLAAGKGVLICKSLQEAKDELKSMLEDSKFGEAGNKVVIEEFLSGIEISVFILTDGNGYVILPSSKDYKRIGEGDTGLNTGGMGSISPVPFADEEFMQEVENRIIKPTIDGLNSEGIKYKGFIFFGLINTADGAKVIEYNARMGDPEAESVMPRIKSDLLDLFIAIGNENLSGMNIELDPRYAAAIMMVSGGYPESYNKGYEITGLDDLKDCILFHAGTKSDAENAKVLTNGGRVLAVTAMKETLDDALLTAYKNIGKISFDKAYYRSDLGNDLKEL